tara:strand:- start:2 stop:292 length:291 start_codon:yes stop_codon:yes gene_type:complete
MSKDEKFNQVWDDVMNIATEEEMRLVCNINGTNIHSLESIIFARVGYHTHEQWMQMENQECFTHQFQEEDCDANLLQGTSIFDIIIDINKTKNNKS